MVVSGLVLENFGALNNGNFDQINHNRQYGADDQTTKEASPSIFTISLSCHVHSPYKIYPTLVDFGVHEKCVGQLAVD